MSGPLPLKSLSLPEKLKEMCDFAAATPPGCFTELGVYQGGTAYRLAQIAREQGRKIYLYDTFTGMPNREGTDLCPVGFLADVDVAAIKHFIPDAIFRIGVFPDTYEPMPPIAFAHIDMDHYTQTKAACELLCPLMVKGGIIFFDDYAPPSSFASIIRAVDEYGLKVEMSPEGRAMVRF